MGRGHTDTEPIADLGSKLRALRQERDWSQRVVAERAGISVAFLSQIENPQSGRKPSREVADRLIAALRTDRATLAAMAVPARRGFTSSPLGETLEGWDRLSPSDRAMVEQLVRRLADGG